MKASRYKELATRSDERRAASALADGSFLRCAVNRKLSQVGAPRAAGRAKRSEHSFVVASQAEPF